MLTPAQLPPASPTSPSKKKKGSGRRFFGRRSRTGSRSEADSGDDGGAASEGGGSETGEAGEAASDEDEIDTSVSVWAQLEEPKLNAKDFEARFAQKPAAGENKSFVTKLLRKTKEEFTALDGKRAQSVGILLGSTKVDMALLAQAVYHMNSRQVRLEVVQALYEQRASPDELDMLRAHLEGPKGKKVPLAKPDEFLWQLAAISQFALRVECWLFRSKFSERVFAVEESIKALDVACTQVGRSEALGCGSCSLGTCLGTCLGTSCFRLLPLALRLLPSCSPLFPYASSYFFSSRFLRLASSLLLSAPHCFFLIDSATCLPLL